jgi:hypothetical protein
LTCVHWKQLDEKKGLLSSGTGWLNNRKEEQMNRESIEKNKYARNPPMI